MSPGRSREGWSCERSTERVPGDVSAAAFWLVAGAIHPDAELTLRGVGVNPTRRAVIDILRAMGADIEERDRPATADDGVGEPHRRPRRPLVASCAAIDLGPAEVAAAIDEIPVLCLAAGQAPRHDRDPRRRRAAPQGVGPDRRASRPGLRALGARDRVDGDDIAHRRRPTALRGAATDSLDDHRLAMTFAIAGLIAAGDDHRSRRPGAAAISYPGFFDDLERVRA